MSKIEQLIELLKENSKDTFLRYALALEHLKLNEFNAAKAIFQDLVNEDPNYLATYYQYGNLLAQMGEIDLATNIFKQGMAVAEAQNKIKTKQEIEQALFLLD
jgi:Tfp pilus assembly protein PilF